MQSFMPAPYSAGLAFPGRDLLDVDAAVLHRLDGAGDLNEAPRGLLWIGVGARFGVFHAVAALPSLQELRMTIFSRM